MDQFDDNPANRGFLIRQKHPEGDTMTATLTTTGGDPVQFSGTTQPHASGVSFYVPGIVNLRT